MEWKNNLTRTPYLVLFVILIAVGVGTASALITITLAGNVIITDDLTVDTNTLFVDSSENNVGIGTITPTEKLDVNGNVAIDGSLDVSNAPIINHRTGGNTANLVIERDGGPSVDETQFVLSHRTSDTDLWLYGFDGTTFKNFIGFDFPNYRITIPSTGNTLVVDGANGKVGIGTTTPEEKLHVIGDVNVDGNVTISGGLAVTGNITGSNFLNIYMVEDEAQEEIVTPFTQLTSVGCDEGDIAIGGGGVCLACGETDFASSYPWFNLQGWTVGFKNPDSSTSGTIEVYAICLDYDPVHTP